VAAKSRPRKDGEGGSRSARAGAGQPKVFKRKSCFLCKDKVREVDYKNVNQLRRYVSERGKIRNRRMTGACRRHQRQIAVAVKRAREMALLPYVAEGGGPPPRSRSGEHR
jgi:small subunit ribosomal protein S18